MRFAYADPPYIGRDTSRLYAGHPDNAGPVDHEALIEFLCDSFPDGWALSGSNRSLRVLLNLAPADTRVLVWANPSGGRVHRNIHPTRAWEPVLLRGGRCVNAGAPVLDFLVANAPGGWYLKDWAYPGAKPPAFCQWLFRCLGAGPGDELVDLFPGSGAVGRAWERFERQAPLPGLDTTQLALA